MGYLQVLATVLALCFTSLVLAQTSGEGDDLITCEGSTQKIRASWVCDGYPDCPLGTDEERCARNCNEEDFVCSDGQCIRYSWACDGRLDCDDGSDEREEICAMTISDSCPDFKFDCTNGVCIRRGYLCDENDDCGNGLDEVDCATPATGGPGTPRLVCEEGFFACEDQRLCVSQNWVCDGEEDCGDSSDETQDHCGQPITDCGFAYFNCSAGGCIDINLVCDGNPSCATHGDLSDEENCYAISCSDQEFKCPMAEYGCIPLTWVCDGEDDCGDGTDELQCDVLCPSSAYACQSGECINSTYLCDGVFNCRDGSDEYKCPLPPPPIDCDADEFRCLDNLKCVSHDSVCDHVMNCVDGSDESMILCGTTISGLGSGMGLVGCQHNPCSQNCTEALHPTSGYFCTCDAGYILNGMDFTSCSDYDECAEPDRCSQLCSNLDGGYNCSCVDGYEIVPTVNGATCVASDGPPAKLLFANQIDIRAVGVSGRNPELLVKHLYNAIAIDYHYRLGFMYWTDIVQETISRAWLNGSNATTIISTELRDPVGLSVDWVNDKLYWADAGRGRIEVSDLDGKNRTVLFANDIGILRAVIVDPMSRYFFWTDWGESPRIERASMDGKERITLHSHFIKWPNALTIDYSTQKLYWADAKLLTLESSFLDGSNRRPIRTAGLRHPFAMTMFEDELYLSDWQTKAIYSMTKFAREFSYNDGYQDLLDASGTVLLDRLYFPMDVKVVHPLRQPMVSNPCGVDNGGCQYLCLISAVNEQGYSCACPAGIRLAEDGKHCEPLDTFILFARRTEILRVSLDVPQFIDVPLPLVNLSGATAIDWDDQTNKIFWTDLGLDTINSANSDGTNQTVLIRDNLYKPAGLAVDWLTRKIYWTEHISPYSRIEVANMDGTGRAIVVLGNSSDPIDRPRDIVVHPMAGLMFWTDWGRNAKIERANLDGSNRLTIVTQNLTYPNGLGIDYESNLLYWCDARYNTIEYSDFYGRGRTVVIHDDMISAHPFGLTIYQNQIYWTDWTDERIQVADKLTGLDRRVLFSNLENRPMDIHVYHRNRSRGESPCDDDNGGCSHHCLSRPSETQPGELTHSCSCPIGHKMLENGKTCSSIIERYLLFPIADRLHEISLDTSEKHLIDFIVNIPNFQAATSVDVDLQTGDIYWADRLLSKIFKFSRSDGTMDTIIDADIVAPESIAVDWIGRKLYWADSVLRRIEVCNLNGSVRRVLFSKNLVQVTSLAIDLESFHLFWTDAGRPIDNIFGKIERADMDGRNRIAVVTSQIGSPMTVAVYNPTGLGGRIYWTDSHHGTIESTDIHGRDRFNLIALSDSDSATPHGLAVEGDYIYWTDTAYNTINRARRVDGNEQVLIRDHLPSVSDIKVIKNTDLSRRADGFIVHPCDGTDQGCSDLCLPNPGLSKYSCLCTTGITLTDDDKTCKRLPPIYMLIASHDTIRRISLDPDVDDRSDVSIIRGLNLTLALDYRLTGVGEGEIIFVDKTYDTIYTSDLDGSNVHPIVQDITSVEGIAYDWIGKNIYWLDNIRKTLEVARYDGSSRKVLIHRAAGYLDRPRGIAVDPFKGFLVMADWSDSLPRIMTARMDGSQARYIIEEGLKYPNGVTLDLDDLRIYWVDAYVDKIESSSYDGRDRITHVDHDFNFRYHPYDVLYFDGFIFWSNVYNDSIHQARLVDHNLVNHVILKDNVRTPSQIQIVSDTHIRPGELGPSGLSYQSACFLNNGGCAYLCLATGIQKRICACPDGVENCEAYVYTDEPTTSIETEPVTKETTEEVDLPTTLPTIKTFTLSGPADGEIVTVAEELSGNTGSQGQLSTAIVASMVVIAFVMLIIVFVVVLATAFIIRRQRILNERQQLQLESMRRLNPSAGMLNSMNPTQRVSGTYTNSNPELVIGNLLTKRNNLTSAYPKPPPPPSLQVQQEKSSGHKPRFHFHRNSSSSLKRGSANVANTNVYKEPEPEVYQLPPKPQPKRKMSVPDSPLFKPAFKPPAPPPPGTEEVGGVFVEKEDLSLSAAPPPRPPKKSTSSDTCSSADDLTASLDRKKTAARRHSKSRDKSCERAVRFDPSLPAEEEPPPIPPRTTSPEVSIPPRGVASSGRKKSKSPPIPLHVVATVETTAPEDESEQTPPTICRVAVDVEPVSDVGGDSSSVDGGVSDCTASTDLGHAGEGKRECSPGSCESSC